MVKRALRSFGYDLRRYVPPENAEARLVTMLAAHGVNLVFDVGANIGLFAQSLRSAGYRGRIASFEPLSAAWSQLNDAAREDPLWEVAPRAAIGARDGEIEFHVAENSISSSALEMLDAHATTFPGSAYVAAERVPLQRLDSVAPLYVRPDSVVFVNADVQGFEHQMLLGASELMKSATGLGLELLLVPLYEGQGKYDELMATLRALGLALWDFRPEFYDPHTGRLMYCTAIFFRD